MGLNPQLVVILLFFLECTRSHIHGCDKNHLREIIGILNEVTGEGVSTYLAPSLQIPR
jgi:hypothetical protein